VVGDDTTGAAFKVYTNATVKPGDRILTLSGTVHTENGERVLYSDSGPDPYFDSQGPIGRVQAAGVGTVAYAATLSDAATTAAEPGGMSTLSMINPSTPDGSWVYLTGQVVTYVGQYWSYDIPAGDGIYVYNVQGIDSTPGIRVWNPWWYGPSDVGSVVDVMAKVDTKDGQRLLGIWNPDQSDAIDLTSSSHSLEPKVLAAGYPLPGVLPVGMNNRNLGGSTMGNNPGVTGGSGLYDIGSAVRVWGEVLESGTYQFDEFGWTQPYMRIDDGSSVPSGNSDPCYGGPYGDTGVTVFGGNTYDWYTPADVGDYIAATGVNSIWKPDGSTDSYRCVWIPMYGSVQKVQSTPQYTRQVEETGGITGAVKLYDMPDASATVRLYSTCGGLRTLTISRGADGSGSASFSWTDVPKKVRITDSGAGSWYDYPQYIISAECDGFKTRTYTQVVPDTPRNLYLTRLRKIYLTTDNATIDSCPGPANSTVVTAAVRDADHNLVAAPLTVRFRTDKGSFATGSVQHTADVLTSTGVATATLYGVPAEWGTATVEATDDSAPLTGDDPDDDPYRYDWEQLHDHYGQPVTIYINPPQVNVTLSASPAGIARCGGDSSVITAHVTYCTESDAPAGTEVYFSTDPGVFTESSFSSAMATTNASGIATVHLRADDDHSFGTAAISAQATLYGSTGHADPAATVTIAEHDPLVAGSANPSEITGPASPLITFTAARPDGSNADLALTIQTSAGSFVGKTNPFTENTGPDGRVEVSLQLSTAQTARITATYADNCVGSTTVSAFVIYRQPRWQTVGVGYSSPFVDDLIAGDGKEVAVISKDDGLVHLWRTDGTAVTVSNDIIDPTGNNTLSAADIDDRGGLEICAPGGDSQQVFAFGYDATASVFKPLAGWPSLSPFAFDKAAAALGDANLDGSLKVIAPDLSCVVTCWNATGGTNFDWGQTPEEDPVRSPKSALWRQVTDNPEVSISNSSVALGDINPSQDVSHIPDAVVGTLDTMHSGNAMNIWGFAADEYHNYYPGYNLTAGWGTNNTTKSVHCSPAVGDLDGDSHNDIAVGDDNGKLWVWSGRPVSPAWTSYPTADAPICSSAALADIDGNGRPEAIFGSDDGRVYAQHPDGTPAPGWAGGVPLHEGKPVKASPVVGDVLNVGTNEPQVVVGCTDGNVYVLWKDAANHAGGAVAAIWTCARSTGTEVLATPTICSLDGSQVSLIVGSTDGMYKIGLYNASFQPGSPRWPWPTFLYNAARTSCNDNTTYPAASVSIIGRVRTSAGVGVPGASVSVEYESGGVPRVAGRSDPRVNPVYTAGNTTAGDEINEGGFVINQLPTLSAGARYKLTINKPGYPSRYAYVTPAAGKNVIADVVY